MNRVLNILNFRQDNTFKEFYFYFLSQASTLSHCVFEKNQKRYYLRKTTQLF